MKVIIAGGVKFASIKIVSDSGILSIDEFYKSLEGFRITLGEHVEEFVKKMKS